MRFKLVLLLFSFSTIILGGEVKLKVLMPGAGGKQIYVYDQADPVTGHSELLVKLEAGENGFICTIPCNNVCWIRIRAGKDEYMLVIREGSAYSLVLPEYRVKSVTEKLNPFFRYSLLHPQTERSNSLNNTVREIDSLYNIYFSRISNSVYQREETFSRDSLLHAFSILVDEYNDPYSVKYFTFRDQLLHMLTRREMKANERIMSMLNADFLPTMPAYTDLVNHIFSGFLKKMESTTSIARLINQSSPLNEIIEIIKEQGSVKNTSLAEYILLKNLYDEYYRSGYKKDSIESLFESIKKEADNEYIKASASHILFSINRLKPGNRPPDFGLPDINGCQFTIDSLKGKHTILVFGSSFLPETESELGILNSWTSQFKGRLQVVVILLDDNFRSSLDRIRSGQYDYIFLDGSDSNNLLEDYDIRYIPSFYFLGPGAELIFSPAVLPSENLRRSVILKLEDSLVDNTNNR